MSQKITIANSSYEYIVEDTCVVSKCETPTNTVQQYYWDPHGELEWGHPENLHELPFMYLCKNHGKSVWHFWRIAYQEDIKTKRKK